MSDSAGHYTVLARRFRPQTFADVVGQDRIGQALRNAIQSGRVAHAYLFTGARGVGKTSTARIFAKALNCPNVQSATPCNDCEVCRGISAGSDVDVLEIDGASNRGIDDIRSLRANVTIRSMRSPYKVYIIDEVHMLTKEAFNALLKTLEEPPPNVKFVFCTTEPNKVPDTILSRCQRFDFGTIAPASIMRRLQQIAVAEGVDVAEDALELLSRRAAGSMRDSQSLFDQLLAFGSQHIVASDVHQLLGTADDDRLIGLLEAVIERRRGDALAAVDRALNEGVQIGAFSDQLLHYLRDLLVIAAGGESVCLESVAESQRPRLAAQATRWGLQTICAALELLAATKGRMQRVNYDRALLELAVIRMSLLEDLETLSTLLTQFAGSGSPMPAPAARSLPAVEPAHQQSPGVLPQGSAAGGLVAQGDASARAEPSETAADTSPVGPDGDRALSLAPASAIVEGVETPSRPVEPYSPSTPSVAAAEPPEDGENVPDTCESSTREAVTAIELTPDTIAEFWSQVVSELPDRLTGHLAKHDRIAIIGPNRLELSFPQSYVLSRQFCERPETVRRVAEAAAKLAGRPMEISVVASSVPGEQLAPGPRRSVPTTSSRIRKTEIERDPFVQQALDVFGGTLIDARELHESTDGAS